MKEKAYYKGCLHPFTNYCFLVIKAKYKKKMLLL